MMHALLIIFLAVIALMSAVTAYFINRNNTTDLSEVLVNKFMAQCFLFIVIALCLPDMDTFSSSCILLALGVYAYFKMKLLLFAK